ncbi:hypothetical protein BQ8482_111793 [Mesorhizobium delmotii]|uniref:Uncharacterized protein n=1 Tax=Mesorhizobium delmotii TaxID=1631247 RepID=A0A2P9AFF6_9HYPH|nr:hypothetical protein BQ8482_111793 [Mesorhizobium delmotii]
MNGVIVSAPGWRAEFAAEGCIRILRWLELSPGTSYRPSGFQFGRSLAFVVAAAVTAMGAVKRGRCVVRLRVKDIPQRPRDAGLLSLPAAGEKPLRGIQIQGNVTAEEFVS